MKLLLNDKELAHFINSHFNHWNKILQQNPFVPPGPRTALHIKYWRRDIREYKRSNRKKPYNVDKQLNNLEKNILKDINDYVAHITTLHDQRHESYFRCIHKNIEHFINVIGEAQLFKLYKHSKFKNFIKGTGFTIDPAAEFVRRKKFSDYSENCLIRNTVGNEQLLSQKIDRRYPFWFIDSGYTNFLEPNKKWHRLVRNHIHHDKMFEAPVDRLSNFRTFPKPWRDSGEKILIIEPGPFAASIFHVDIKTWKYDVERELKKYTDKKIVFREKAEKKIRTRLVEELQNEDYYCVVSINSNAATEAVWCGIPVITLDKHITSPISRHKLSDINNLARPHLARWLCALSYSQFTVDELYDGTAFRCVNTYQLH